MILLCGSFKVACLWGWYQYSEHMLICTCFKRFNLYLNSWEFCFIVVIISYICGWWCRLQTSGGVNWERERDGEHNSKWDCRFWGGHSASVCHNCCSKSWLFHFCFTEELTRYVHKMRWPEANSMLNMSWSWIGQGRRAYWIQFRGRYISIAWWRWIRCENHTMHEVSS